MFFLTLNSRSRRIQHTRMEGSVTGTLVFVQVHFFYLHISSKAMDQDKGQELRLQLKLERLSTGRRPLTEWKPRKHWSDNVNVPAQPHAKATGREYVQVQGALVASQIVKLRPRQRYDSNSLGGTSHQYPSPLYGATFCTVPCG